MSGLRRGYAALKETKQQSGSGGETGLRFILKDGETAPIRIFGDFENEQDPVIFANHFVKRIQNKKYHNCADNNPEGHAGCVFCYQKNNGDKGVGKSARALFFVKDLRKQHKFENKVRILKPGRVAKPGVQLPPDAYDETQYPPCRGKMCQFCSQGNEAKIQGYRHWELALQYADQLMAQQATLRDYCKCGAMTDEGGGSIYTEQYLCGNPECQQPVDFFPDAGSPVSKCDACNQTMPPMEQIACTACSEPARCDLSDFFWKVTRSGSEQDTSYNFEAVKPCKPLTEEELAEANEKRPDFDALLAPEPAEIQAKHLGIPCPFNTPGHGSQQYEQPPEQPPARRGIPTGGGTRNAAPTPPAKAPPPPKRAPVQPNIGGKKFVIPGRKPVAPPPEEGEQDIPFEQ